MIERYESAEKPDLASFPSAEAQDGLPIKGRSMTPPRKGRGWMHICIKTCGYLIIALTVVVVGALLVLSQRSVSNEQLRAGIESQLTGLLGENHSAKIGEAKIALGQGGLLAIDANNVRILKDGSINLGGAEEILVKLKAVPLLGGQIVAKSLALNDANIAIENIFPPTQNSSDGKASELHPIWPRSVNLDSAMRQLGDVFRQIAESLESAGLERIELNGTKLIGFEHFGLRSKTAKFTSFKIEKSGSRNNGLSFDAVLNTQFNDWKLQGEWKPLSNGGDVLILSASGLVLQDLAGDVGNSNSHLNLTSPVTLKLEAPFLLDGTPQQSTLQVKVSNGDVALSGELITNIANGTLNFRLVPEKNQIDLERSKVEVDGHSATLIGGLRYPSSDNDPISNTPAFKIEAEEFDAFGMATDQVGMKGRFNIEGLIDPLRQSIALNSINISTPNGEIIGEASGRFDAAEPHFKVALSSKQIPVDELKQFWPSFIAPNTHNWIEANIKDGTISNARLSADFPPGLFGEEVLYKEANLSTRLNITGTTVRTVGKLPSFVNTDGFIELKGNRTFVRIDRADAKLPNQKKITVGNSSLTLGPFSDPMIDGQLLLGLSGSAASLGALTALDPLDFAKNIDVDLSKLSGTAQAQISANILLAKRAVLLGPKKWSAKINLRKAGLRQQVSGRTISNLNAIINANPVSAKINGDALVDGVPAKLALVQSLSGKNNAASSISMVLDHNALKKFGVDTAGIVTGPIKVELAGDASGGQLVEADLRSASLNLPWIGWSKGKGIPATASFVMSDSKGVRKLKGLKLRGKGFSANGNLTLAGQGLQSAQFSKVKLNNTDDFDIALKRTKSGFDVRLDARSYDGRALIRSFLAKGKKESTGGASIKLSGKIRRLLGFGNQTLSNVTLDFSQRGTRIGRAVVNAMASGNAPTIFSLKPVAGGMKTEITTSNAGSVLRFLDLYEKVRGGTINATLVRDGSNVFRGVVEADRFVLIGEPRLTQLLQKPSVSDEVRGSEQITKALRRIKTDRVTVDRLQARIEKGEGFLNISKGRVTGGDASAAFDGIVYNQNNRMNVKGTYLPGRGLNRLVSKIPLIGLAFGAGKVNGLLGITFRLSGRYGNPKLEVNPLSIIAPGVFRQLFKF